MLSHAHGCALALTSAVVSSAPPSSFTMNLSYRKTRTTWGKWLTQAHTPEKHNSNPGCMTAHIQEGKRHSGGDAKSFYRNSSGTQTFLKAELYYLTLCVCVRLSFNMTKLSKHWPVEMAEVESNQLLFQETWVPFPAPTIICNSSSRGI